VALIGLGLTFVGAVVICLSREAADPDPDPAPGPTHVPTETV
jgi:hypothetical protein